MTSQELVQLVSLGEGAFLEFKHRVPRPERIAKEVIAFANSNGGRILLGVSDDGSVPGVRDATEEEFALTQALKNYVDPAIDISIERVVVNDSRDVLVVTVPESPDKPHFLINNGAPVSYVRVNHMSVEAGEEVEEYLRSEKDASSLSFSFGEKEQMLMRYLESYGHITASQFAELTDTSRRDASTTLVDLSRADVLRLHPDAKETYFTLAFESTERKTGS